MSFIKRFGLTALAVMMTLLACSVSNRAQERTTSTATAARIAELTPPDKNIPENQIILADEIRRINDELARIRRTADQYNELITNIRNTKELATKTFQEIAALRCDPPPPERFNSDGST